MVIKSMTIKVKLPELMAEKGVNQMDLVRELNLSPTTVGKLYRQKSTRIDFDTIEKLCGFFQIQITDLLDLQLDQQ